MTDEKSQETGKSQDIPTVTDKAEPKSNFAKAAQDAGGKGGGKTREGKRSGGKGWLWLLLFAAILGGGGAWAWFNWPQVQSKLARYVDFPSDSRRETAGAPESVQDTGEIVVEEVPEPDAAPLQNTQPDSGDKRALNAAQEQANAALRNQLRRQQNTIGQLQQQIAELQRNVTAQGNRLGELGNASREDWQLAEADYLLRLANQRLLLERDSRAALGLLEEVDTIVRQVDLPDLYGVRQQLARDIAELKLVENVDREGIYLRLRAIEDQLLRTSIQPQFDLAKLDDTDSAQTEGSADTSAWQRSWNNFTEFMRDSIRIRDGNIDPVLLSPQSEVRFRQTLRLNMEQAELALLRGNTSVYRDALQRARQLLLNYGIASNQRDVLARELQELSELTIESDLPSLAASQSALHNYLERLHKTRTPSDGNNRNDGSAQPQVNFPDSEANETSPGSDSQ